MDQSVDPCEDFYAFGCGSWLKDHPIPETSNSYGIYSWLRQQRSDITHRFLSTDLLKAPSTPDELEAVTKAKVFYRSCVNEKQLDSQPMLKTLQQPEFRWPVVGEGLGGEWQWSPRQWDLQRTLAATRVQHSKNILIPKAYRAALLSLMVDMAMMLGAPERAARLQMDEVLQFEIKLAKMQVPFEQRTSENMYNKYTLSRLQRLVPQLVIVRAPQYFKDLFKLINATDPRTVANYVQWRSVLSRATALSRRFLYRYLDYARVS
ncbi:hypothetical protein NHX12_021305 [Muraenolepis orangiensis]|uniref:Peptidase M13 N-terminal domain-containing protein n=1 Tax=Muraenolepis orangiensis TaxID=630683 RepID=A0A9Q0IUC1_9TELE|nr:hypothetical protein NHX12_021305 [Muraenolepis orangiensis]